MMIWASDYLIKQFYLNLYCAVIVVMIEVN